MGNPGGRYSSTRHNAGAWVVEALAREYRVSPAYRHRSLVVELSIEGVRSFFAIPQTYMNDSGVAVRELLRYYPVAVDGRLLVVHDELDLPVGEIRLKRGGGLAGHNGLRSIAQHLDTRSFHRLRVGIGRPEGRSEIVDYVLRPPSKPERAQLDVAIAEAVVAVTDWITLGSERAMTLHNHRVAPSVE
ncbi:MAG: aminoacyl-tRNA hydrolase [Ferrimicrobium sp.]